MRRLDSLYDSAPDSPSEIAKTKLRNLSEGLTWDTPDVCRVVARRETARKERNRWVLVEQLKDALLTWRTHVG